MRPIYTAGGVGEVTHSHRTLYTSTICSRFFVVENIGGEVVCEVGFATCSWTHVCVRVTAAAEWGDWAGHIAPVFYVLGCGDDSILYLSFVGRLPVELTWHSQRDPGVSRSKKQSVGTKICLLKGCVCCYPIYSSPHARRVYAMGVRGVDSWSTYSGMLLPPRFMYLCSTAVLDCKWRAHIQEEYSEKIVGGGGWISVRNTWSVCVFCRFFVCLFVWWWRNYIYEYYSLCFQRLYLVLTV